MGSGKFLVGVTAGFFLLILFVGLQAGYINNLVVLRDGTNTLTGNWNAGNFNITADYFFGNVECSLNRSYVYFFDEFIGDTLEIPPWKRTTQVDGWSVIVTSELGGWAELRSGNTIASSSTLTFGTRLQFIASKNPFFEVYAHLHELTNLTCFLGYSKLDGQNHIGFRYAHVGVGTWHTTTLKGGIDTDLDTGITGDTSSHFFRIEISTSTVTFFIDDVLVNTHTTNIPILQLDPELYIKNTQAGNKRLHVDYILLIQDRV